MYNGQMSRGDIEALKARIRSELGGSNTSKIPQNFDPMTGRPLRPVANRMPVNQTPPANMQTLSHEEFHPDTMIAGSTGAYKDMNGGAHFQSYDCGHEYNDSVIRNTDSTKEVPMSAVIKAAFKDKAQVRNAFIMSEIFDRPKRRRFSSKFN